MRRVYLKRWSAGSIAVAIPTALITYNAGYAANGDGSGVHSLFVFVATTALCMGLVGQPKDLSGIEGDKRAGRRSGPVVWGEDTARLVFLGIALPLDGGYILSTVLLAPGLLIPAFVLTFGTSAVAVVTLGPWSRGHKSKHRRPYRAVVQAQYVATLTVVVL